MNPEVKRIVRKAFQAGRAASRHYQTVEMSEAACGPIEAELEALLAEAASPTGGQLGPGTPPDHLDADRQGQVTAAVREEKS